MVEAPPSLFDATQLKGRSDNFSDLPPAPPGGFLIMMCMQIMRKSKQRLMVAGTGWVWQLGCGQTNILCEGTGQTSAIRLDTTWVRDQPMQMASLRFGDVISGRAVGGGECAWRLAVGDQFFHPA